MADVKEITITCKNDEKRMTYKHLVYETVELSIDDPIISELIRMTVKDFGDPDCDIKFKATMVI